MGQKKKSRAMHSAHKHTNTLLSNGISNKMESNRYTLYISWCSYAIWENYQVYVHNKVCLSTSEKANTKPF